MRWRVTESIPSEEKRKGLKALLKENPAEIQGDLIFPLLDDSDSSVRSLAADVLVHAGHPAVLPYLINELGKAVVSEKPNWIRKIGELKDPAGLLALMDLWKEPDSAILDSLASAFSNLGKPAFYLLVSMFLPLNREVKVRLLRAFSRAGFDYEAVLEAALRDSDWWVRREAVSGLAARPSREAFVLLEKACLDSYFAVRLEAVRVLAKLKGSTPVYLLHQMERDNNPDVAAAASLALAA